MFKSALKYFILGLILVTPPGSALAASKGTLEATPAYVEVVLDKSEQTKKIVFSYTNHSTKPIDLEIFPIDFKQADGTGAINFLGTEAGSFSYSLSSFLSFESNSLQLDPGERKDFVVTVKNREDLSPGGHYAAVVARLSAKTTQTGDAQVAPSISSLILLRKVGGERFNLSLSDLDFPSTPVAFSYPATITALFKNEGNIHLVPFGNVEIKDIFGRLIYRGVINTSSLRIFPETRRYIQIDMDKLALSWPVSFNSITIRGQDSLGKVQFNNRDSFLYIDPLFTGALILGITAWAIVKRRYKKEPKKIKNK